MKKLISVTQKDIDTGIRISCINCPVATALTRDTGSLCEVFQTHPNQDCELWCHRPGIPIKAISAPRSVNRFVKRFDRGLPVKPFRFYFEVES